MPLPKPFETEDEFLEFFEGYSKTSRAAFSIEQVNYIFELAGEKPPFDFSSNYISMALHYDEPRTRELLDKASKNILEKERRKNGGNIRHLDDYR